MEPPLMRQHDCCTSTSRGLHAQTDIADRPEMRLLQSANYLLLGASIGPDEGFGAGSCRNCNDLLASRGFRRCLKDQSAAAVEGHPIVPPGPRRR
jgi:hypothetical protein